MAKKSNPSAEMFIAKDAGPIYTAIINGIKSRVSARNAIEDPKQTCVHVNAGEGGTAYLGLHPRKGAVLITIRTEKPIESSRIRKAEQVSANRCHCDTLVKDPTEVDEELLGWMESAWQSVSKKKTINA